MEEGESESCCGKERDPEDCFEAERSAHEKGPQMTPLPSKGTRVVVVVVVYSNWLGAEILIFY